jgi:hypothetical protein
LDLVQEREMVQVKVQEKEQGMVQEMVQVMVQVMVLMYKSLADPCTCCNPRPPEHCKQLPN